jgi:predicted nucleotidyltransferase
LPPPKYSVAATAEHVCFAQTPRQGDCDFGNVASPVRLLDMNIETVGRMLVTAAGEFPGIVSLYLFGSVAHGRPHSESDIDVGLLLDWVVYPKDRDRFEVRVRFSSATSTRSAEVDVVILNDAPPHLGREIVTRGRRLLCRNEAADHTFVRDVQLKAADLDPWLQRMRRIKLDALARR